MHVISFRIISYRMQNIRLKNIVEYDGTQHRISVRSNAIVSAITIITAIARQKTFECYVWMQCLKLGFEFPVFLVS